MENMTLGLTLMLIGMFTVFIILLIVINLSKVLISIVNKIAPEEETAKKKAEIPAPAATKIDSNVMAIIEAAVKELTGGKGTVANVEKL